MGQTNDDVQWLNTPVENAVELGRRMPPQSAHGFVASLQRLKTGMPARHEHGAPACHPLHPRGGMMAGMRPGLTPRQIASLFGRAPHHSPQFHRAPPIPRPSDVRDRFIGPERRYLGPAPLNQYAGGVGPFGSVNNSGPSTDNAVARFDGASGTMIQNSGVTVDDSGNTVVGGNLRAANINYPVADGGNGHVVKSNGSGQLSIGQVGTAGIADREVTYPKLPAVAASRLLGRGSTGSGDAQEISLGAGLSMSGQTLNVSGSGGDVSGPSSATDNAITRFDGTTGKLIQNSGATLDDAGKITAGALTAAGLDYPAADGAAGQVVRSNGAGVLSVGQASTSGIADNAITNGKLSDMANATIKARKTSGTGDPEDCTLSEVLDLVGGAAQGDILYRGAGDWTRLPAGTSGQFLKTQGGGANPAWDSAPSMDINGLTSDSAISATDPLPYYKAASSGNRKLTYQQLMQRISALSAETAPATNDELLLNDVSEGGGTANKITLQNMLRVIAQLAAETAPATGDEIFLNDVSESGGTPNKMTLANLMKVINGLTALTTPARNDNLAVYDTSDGSAKRIAMDNLGANGVGLFSTVVEYTGSGSSGKTVTLTGINRAYYVMAMRNDTTGTHGYWMLMPNGGTGTQTVRESGGGANTVISLDGPSAGTNQTMTINTTSASYNGNGVTYRLFVVGKMT